MNTRISTFVRQTLIAGAVMAAASSAMAATTTWNFSNAANCSEVTQSSPTKITDTVGGTQYVGTIGNSWTCNTNDVDPNVTVTAWSTTGSGSSFAQAWLPIWNGNGFGVVANNGSTDLGTPNHALDNNGSTDLILLNFSSNTVDLDSIKLGYISGDADISLFRYNGNGSPSVSGLTTGTMGTGSWQLVGNYGGLTSTGVDYAVNSGSQTSSWWLISAYNSGYGTAVYDNTGSPSGSTNDYFKVYSVTGTATAVPEPTSLALFGAALIGFVASRRRKNNAS